MSNPRSAPIRLGTSDGLGEHLDLVIEALARLSPPVRVELTSAPTRTRLDQVRTCALDATFVRGVAERPELRLIPVWQDRIALALPINHPLSDAPTVDLGELAGMPLRLADRARNAPLHDVMVAACRAAGFEPVFGPPFTTMQDTLAMVGGSADTWTVVYEAHARRLPTARVAFRATATPIVMTTSLVVSETNPPWCFDHLLQACDHRI
ncbi:LysR family substrate-binding domain-containing protein [Nocardia sp. NPDC023852]|uniref:LysR family substrate-binding domain-containing protein n=1 Tax=Nocardia sp. NPDC023852 TaxID=3154697 RepID=UPI0033F2C74E